MRHILDVIWEYIHIYSTEKGKKPETLLIHPLTYEQLKLCVRDSNNVVITEGSLGTCFGLRIVRSEDIESNEIIVF